MNHRIQFGINRISAPRQTFADYLAMCKRIGVSAIEIRNDLKGVEISDGTPAAELKAQAEQVGIVIRSINALYPFDVFDAGLEARARSMAAYARACGAQALVMCPLNSRDDQRTEAERRRDLVHALRRLRPILDEHGIEGLVEPLGFEECVLRRKSDAVEAIYAAAGERHFKLVHDTFHHHLAGEDIFFPDLTGLVHVSGVESAELDARDMRDGHRVLVGEGDRLGNIAQLRTLLDRGYRGLVSFEPFAAEVMEAENSEALLAESMHYIHHALS
ncbi:TIM barrel protein [Ralstonia pseudosolanacearum]|uniref:TIM barrel protein n=1 Tax=Ralstonia pseudosolanacearum TaxID=1310165 RepID=UPI0008D9ACD3|nr:TIM barrel protein [Ralstonia pseudosolanacearum]MCL1619898.1 TIM barrel protein [Ralstonia pseudosolanacearum CaRs-Mep]MCQ4680550.1 TIM barrel protein [Ralstonia pseudosolanacearum]